MKHAREDYNRIQDPAVNDSSLLPLGGKAIPADEPVFLLRAQDVNAHMVVRYWVFLHLRTGGDPEMAERAYQHADDMASWPTRKIPDMPKKGLSVFDKIVEFLLDADRPMSREEIIQATSITMDEFNNFLSNRGSMSIIQINPEGKFFL